MDEPQLRASVLGVVPRLFGAGAMKLRQEVTAGVVVHGTPVVGIDQGKVPDLAALIDVGHARAGEQQCRLRPGS